MFWVIKVISCLVGINRISYESGPKFNIKMPSYQYRKSYCGDKTVVRSSHLHNWITYTGKTTSLFWIRALILLQPAPIPHDTASGMKIKQMNQTLISQKTSHISAHGEMWNVLCEFKVCFCKCFPGFIYCEFLEKIGPHCMIFISHVFPGLNRSHSNQYC